MLKRIETRNTGQNYAAGHKRYFFDDPARFPESLGCSGCMQRDLCGGLHVLSGAFDCLSYCCATPDACDSVCPRNVSNFVARSREVLGFDQSNVPSAQRIPAPDLPPLVPMLHHGYSRTQPFNAPAVALPLYALHDRHTGDPRYMTRDELCRAFRISTGSVIVASGTDVDSSLERWWQLGPQRRRILVHLKHLGVAAVTSPNYSLFSNTPRFDDLHSMKRIAITWHEIAESGIAAALHVNARTAYDWRRWRDFVVEREEITMIAFEFATGASDPHRLRWYSDQLCRLADEVRRPLTLIMRGGASIMCTLSEHFASVTMIDATPLMKALKRQKVVRGATGERRWRRAPGGSSVQSLLEHNYLELAQPRLGRAESMRSPSEA